MQAIPELDARGLRSFGLTFAVILAVLFGLVLPWLFDYGYPVWPWLVGALCCAVALAAPLRLDGFYQLWMRFGLLMNAIISRVVLGIMFFGLITPMAFVMRLVGRDPLMRGRDPERASYRTQSKPRDANHMERPF